MRNWHKENIKELNDLNVSKELLKFKPMILKTLYR